MKVKKIIVNLDNKGEAIVSVEDSLDAIDYQNLERQLTAQAELQQKKLTNTINILDELKGNADDNDYYIIPNSIESVPITTWVNQGSDRVVFVVPDTSITQSVELNSKQIIEALYELLGFPVKENGRGPETDKFHNIVHRMFRDQGHFQNVQGSLKYFETDEQRDLYKMFLVNPLKFITRRFAESLGKKRALFTETQLKEFQSKEALYNKLLNNPPEMLRYIDKKYVIEDSVNMLRVILELQTGGKLNEYGTYGMRQYTSSYPFLKRQMSLVEEINDAVFPRWRNRNGNAEEIIKRNRETYDKVDTKVKREYKVSLKELFNGRLPMDKAAMTVNLLKHNSILSDYRLECEVY